MNKTITYGQLHHKLHEFGFNMRTIQLDGKIRHVFEHKTLDNAMIVLPERNHDDPVEPFYMVSVLATLKSHGLLAENNPLLV